MRRRRKPKAYWNEYTIRRCEQKIRYGSAFKAYREVERRGCRLSVYRCGNCYGYHITGAQQV